jgi:hypothetical protein
MKKLSIALQSAGAIYLLHNTIPKKAQSWVWKFIRTGQNLLINKIKVLENEKTSVLWAS